MEEIEQIAAQFKDDLQRKKDGYIRKDENKDAYAALLGQEYVDQFIWQLKLWANSGMKEHLERPPRARPIRINKHLLSKAK